MADPKVDPPQAEAQPAPQPVPGTPTPPRPDDMAARDAFMQDRTSRPDDSWIKALASGQAPQQEKPIAGVTEGKTAPIRIQMGNPQGMVDVPGVGSVPLSDPYTPIGSKVLGVADSVAKDIGKGIVHLPSEVIGGGVDFANNLFKFADDVVKKADEAGIPNIYFRLFDKNGKWSPTVMSPEEFRKAQQDGQDDVFQIPNFDKPDSVTGNIVRTATTFMLGRGNLAKGAGVAGQAGADFASGALMNPSDQRLSNVIDSVAPNFVTDWMKAKPSDEGTLLGRLKSGMEYAGLGLMFEGAKRALKAVKQSHGDLSSLEQRITANPQASKGPSVAAGTPGPAVKPASGVAVEAPQRDFLAIGNPLDPPVSVPDSVSLRDMADRWLRGEEIGQNPVKINLAKVDSEESIKDILSQVSTSIPSTSPVTWEQTKNFAQTLGVTPEQLLSNYSGSTLNSRDLLAAKWTTESAAQQLYHYAQLAIDPATATPENKAIAVKAFLTQRALQQYFENARSEAGRTLNILKMMSKAPSQYGEAVDNIVKGAQEADMEKLFGKIVSLGDPADPDTAAKVAGLVGKSFTNRGRDALTFFWYNYLLSNPRTLAKKATSDAFNATWNVLTHKYAEVAGSSGEIQPGEAAQLLYGYVGSWRDGVRAAGKAIKAGESQFWKDYENSFSVKPQNLLGENVAEPLADAAEASASGLLRRFMPTAWIGAVDDMATVMNYRAYARVGAYREAMQKGLQGDALTAHMADRLDNIPGWLHNEAVDNALRSTFKEPVTGKIAGAMSSLSNVTLPLAHTQYELPIGKIFLPFVKIPANIAKWSYRNSALAAAFPTKAVQEELASGGAARDLAIARMTMGSAVALGFADLALNNAFTGKGPSDPQLQRAWRQAGNEPYSVKVGDRWYGYNYVEPFGMMMGAIADTYDTMRFAREDGMNDNLAASLAFGVGNALLSKTYMMGVANIFDAMNDPERKAGRFVEQIMSSALVPQGVSAMSNMTDDWVRTHYGIIQSAEARLPWLRKNFPPLRTKWGDPIPVRDAYLPLLGSSKYFGAISPVPSVPVHAEPIDKWIWDNRLAFPHGDANKLGLSKPGMVQTFSGGSGISVQVRLDPEVHDRLLVLAGNELKDPRTGLGAKDTLNALVEGKYPQRSTQDLWNRYSPEMRALLVQKIDHEFQKSAKEQILREYPDLRSAVEGSMRMKADKLRNTNSPAPALNLQ